MYWWESEGEECVLCLRENKKKKKKKERRARSEPAKRKEIVRMSGGGLIGVVGEHMESQKKKI